MNHAKSWLITLFPLLVLGVSCNESSNGGVFRSLDSGETWEQVTFVSSTGKNTTTISEVDVLAMTFHPEDTNIIYLGTKSSGLYLTLTGGESWYPSDVESGSIRSIAIDPIDPNNVYLAKDKTVMKSTDQGLTWETVYSDVQGGTITVVAIDSFEHSRVYAATSAGTVLKSVDYGINWDLVMQIGDSIKQLLIAPHDTRIMYVLTDDKVLYRSVTGGQAKDGDQAEDISSGWSELITKEVKESYDNSHQVFGISLDQNDSTILYTVTRRGIMRGENNGETWSDIITLVGVDDKKNDSIRNLSTVLGKPNELYFTLGQVIHKSVDGGVTWKVIENFPSTRIIYQYLVDPQTPNVMYAGMYKEEEQRGLIKQN